MFQRLRIIKSFCMTRLPIISRLLYRLTIQNHVNCSNRQKPTQSMGTLKYGVVIYRLVLIHYLTLPAGKFLKVSAWLKVSASSMVKQVPIKDIIPVLYRTLSLLLHAPQGTHWVVENSLHCVLDVTFREDDSRTRTWLYS